MMAIYDLLGAAIALLAPNKKTKAKEYATYTLEWNPMTAGAVKQKPTGGITIDASYDFVALAAFWYSTSTATPPVESLAPQLLFNMNVTGGRQVHDKDIPLKNFCGQQVTNGAPSLFPIYLPRTSTLNGFITDLGNTAQVLRITFHGFLIYDREAGDNVAGGY
jgi:hypothetical protein